MRRFCVRIVASLEVGIRQPTPDVKSHRYRPKLTAPVGKFAKLCRRMQRLMVAWSLLCCSSAHALHATGVHRRLPTMRRRMGALMGAPEEVSPMARPPTAPPPASRPPPAAPGAFHPGIVCAVQKQIIVGYRYDRPATDADRAAARAAGYVPIDTYSICQEAYDALPAADQATKGCI